MISYVLNTVGIRLVWALSMLSFLVTVNAHAERYSTVKKSGAGLRYKAEEKSAPTSVFGTLELRPGVSTKNAAFSTENWAELGVKLSKDTTLSYEQDVGSENTEGVQDVQMGDGIVHLRMGNLYAHKEWKLTFSDQVRIFLPTVTSKRDAGMFFAVRNYFILSSEVSPSVSFVFKEIPIFHVYSQAGITNDDGDAVANPTFENRIIFGPNFKFAKNFSFNFPVLFYTTKFRDYTPKAKNNDSWIPSLTFNPELTYQANSNFYVGTGYRTDNLLQTEETGTVLVDQAGTGIFQFFVGVSF